MDSTTCQRTTHERLNICDDHEVDALCEALNCRRTDVYEAVAYVGDYVCCVEAFLKKTTPVWCMPATRSFRAPGSTRATSLVRA